MRRAALGWASAALLWTAARLGVAGRAGLGDDEAYYWRWSNDLAWSYFDHPAPVAAGIAAGTAVLGDGALGVRLFTVLAGTGLVLAVGALARAAGAPAVWAAAFAAFTPQTAFLGLFAAPDAPMLLAGAVGLAVLLGGGVAPSRGRLAAAGLCVGLAVASKATGGLFALAFVPALRARRPGAVLAVGAVALGALPALLWNAGEGWPSLRFHAVSRHAGAPDPLTGLGLLVGGAVALVGPAVLGFGLPALGRAPAPLAWVAGGTGLVCLAAAPVTRVLPHWSAPMTVALLPLVARVAAAAPRRGAVALAVSALPVALVLGQALTQALPLAGVPSVDLHPAARAALAGALHAADPEGETPICAHMYQLAAQAAWAAPPGAEVRRVGGRRDDQWTIWRADALPPGLCRWVDHDGYPGAAVRRGLGLDCTQAAQAPLIGGGARLRTWRVWRCAPGAQAPR